DGVRAVAGAGVLAGGALVGGVALGRRVGDPVALAAAAVLEGVVEAEPVPGLVDGAETPVEAVDVAARHALGVDDHAVADRLGAVLPGERRPAEQVPA